MKKFNYVIPFLMLFGLLAFLGYELFHAKPYEIPSALVGEDVPNFHLPSLAGNGQVLSSSDLHGRTILLNVWATWCYACSIEHDMLMKISHQDHVPIYSILYKDQRGKGLSWLNEHGNPYVMTGDDSNGDVAIDLGVYGTPETFVISPAGKIVYRHVGAIDQDSWDNVLYPLIKKLDAG